MVQPLILIVLGLALLVGGGEALLRGAVALARRLHLTPAVIGLTVVAAGTSVPELAVSLFAAARGSADIAVGNVVGSNIFNIAFILGFSAIFRPLVITGSTIKLEYPAMVLVTLAGIGFGMDGLLSRLDALLLISFYAAFTAYVVRIVRRRMIRPEIEEFKGEVKELAGPDGGSLALWRSLLYVAAGVALLAGGAQATLSGAVKIAQLLGLSERVIGLTIVAAGTGLPELVTSLVSSYRGRDDVAIANVLGSNLFNVAGILSLGALMSPLPVHRTIIAFDNWWMLGTSLLLFPLMFTGRRINILEGLVLSISYGIYLSVLLKGGS